MRYVEWDEPYPGYDEQGECTCNIHCQMTVDEAIKASRFIYKNRYPGEESPSHEILLDEFVVVHWATIKEEPDGDIH